MDNFDELPRSLDLEYTTFAARVGQAMEINGLVVPMRITSFLSIRMAGDKQYREMMYTTTFWLISWKTFDNF